jgi:molybdopterin synthase catalytic subunit
MGDAAPSIVIETPASFLDPDALRSRLPVHGSGAVASFLGLTRGVDDGVDILRLEFDAWEEELPRVLHSLAEAAIERFGVSAVAIAHRTGAVGPAEPIVAIHVASPHRGPAFDACRWLIDELKQQAPLWKREVTADGAQWKAGLG